MFDDTLIGTVKRDDPEIDEQNYVMAAKLKFARQINFAPSANIQFANIVYFCSVKPKH